MLAYYDEEKKEGVSELIVTASETVQCMQLIGNSLLTGGDCGVISRWDLVLRDRVEKATAQCGLRVRSVCGGWRPEGSLEDSQDALVYAGMQDGRIESWDLRMNLGQPVRVFKGHAECPITAMVSTSDEGLATASLDGTVKRWDLRMSEHTGLPVWPEATQTYTMHTDGITGLVLSQGWLYSVSRDRTAREVAIGRFHHRRKVPLHGPPAPVVMEPPPERVNTPKTPKNKARFTTPASPPLTPTSSEKELEATRARLAAFALKQEEKKKNLRPSFSKSSRFGDTSPNSPKRSPFSAGGTARSPVTSPKGFGRI